MSTVFRRRGWQNLTAVWSVGLLFLLCMGCRGNRTAEMASGFPEEVAPILVSNCATSGCHSAQSAPGAGGLNLESWEGLFAGSRGGSAVVPYEPDQSFLMFSVNTDTSLGPTLYPTMPFNRAPLSQEEYYALWQWVHEGARNAKGAEFFPPNAARKKWYVSHNQCDAVAVFDAESRQIMRYVEVGQNPDEVEQAFSVNVSPDGQDWFVVFATTHDVIERYSTLTDEKVADIRIGDYAWSTMDFSPDGKFAFVAGEYVQKLAVIDLGTNALTEPARFFAQEVHSPSVHPQYPRIYLPQHIKQRLYVLDYDANGLLSNQREVDLVQGWPAANGKEMWPQEVVFLPDGSKYFVSCWNSEELRVYDGQNDSLLDVVPVPATPGIMAYSAQTQQLFLACMDDLSSWAGSPGKRGSVLCIDPTNHQILKTLYAGFQPYALDVDESNGVLVVANRNTDLTGPAPHHVSTCGDRNGYVTLIDLSTLELIPDYKPELLVDPLSVAVK